MSEKILERWLSAAVFKVILNISALHQLSIGLQNDVMLATLLLWRKWNIHSTGMRESSFCFVLINWHGGRIVDFITSQQPVNRKGVRESQPCVSRDGTGMTMVMQRSSAGAQKRRGRKDPGLVRIVTEGIQLCAVIYDFLCIPADGCSLRPDGPSSRTWLNLQQVNRGADDNAPALRNDARSCTAELVQKEKKTTRQFDPKTGAKTSCCSSERARKRKVMRIVAAQTQQTCKGACTVLCVAAERFRLTRPV